MSDQIRSAATSRRDFLKSSSTAIVAGSLAATLGAARTAHASGSDILKIGLIGCGGRGSGAVVDAMQGDKNLELTVLADAFADRLQHSKDILSPQLKEKYKVTDDHCFVGFDAYKHVMASDVDVVDRKSVV